MLRTDVISALKEGGRSNSADKSHARLRSALVIGEVAVAMARLAASGLLLRSFEKMSQSDLGFRPDHVVTAYYSLLALLALGAPWLPARRALQVDPATLLRED